MNIFCKQFFKIIWWIENSKEQNLFETEIFCNNAKIFTVTFDQFNAFLLNKSSSFFKNVKNKNKNPTDPNPYCRFNWYIYIDV